MKWKNAISSLKAAAARFIKSATPVRDQTQVVGLTGLAKLFTQEVGMTGMLEMYRKSLYVFACISKIATKVAAVQIKLQRVMNSKGEMKEVVLHPLLDLLNRPNKLQTKSEFIELTLINWEACGHAFWYKVMNNAGRIVELWNLRPDMVEILTDPKEIVLGYRFNRPDGSFVDFIAAEVVHFNSPDPLNLLGGVSPLKAAQKRILTEEYATKWQADFFLNSARPDGLIKNGQANLTEEQKNDIREGWKKRYGGLDNAYKVAILEGGLEYQLIGISQKEMDYIESLKFTRDDILVAFGVPKPIVAVVDDVNRANSETAMTIFLSETIAPRAKRLWEKVNEEMVYPDFGDEFYIEYVDPTPVNREMQLKEYENGTTNHWLLINEIRQREGLPPIRGGWSMYMPLINQAVGGLSAGDQEKRYELAIKDSDRNEQKMLEYMAQKDKKTYDFSGRSALKRKFEMKELLAAAVKIAVNKTITELAKRMKKSFDKKSVRPLITDPELKKAYAKLFVKAGDAQAEKMKPALNGFFAAQKERVISNLESKAQKAVTATAIFEKDSEMQVTLGFVEPYIADMLIEAAKRTLGVIAPSEDFETTQRIREIIRRRAQELATDVGNTTIEKLDATLAEGISSGEGIGELKQRVDEVYGQFPDYRSELIARTEATAANSEGAEQGMEQSGVANAKEWINVGDDRVRPEHMDAPAGVGGEIVALGASFSNGLQFPEEPNCRCALGPAWMEK